MIAPAVTRPGFAGNLSRTAKSTILLGAGYPLGRKHLIVWLAICWVIVAGLDVAAVRGLANLGFNDGVGGAFRSDTQTYRDYETFLEQFGSSTGQVILVFEGRDFGDPEALNRVADILIGLQFTDGVVGALSPFSLEFPPGVGDGGSVIPPLVEDRAALLDRLALARDTLPALSRFLSEDRRTLMAILAITGDHAAIPDRPAFYAAIEKEARDAGADAGIQVTVTGFGVLGDRLVEKLFDDFLMLIIFGAVAGTLVAIVALRSLVLALMAAAASGTALLWVLGAMALVGFEINVVTVALPALVLVLSFADALHLGLEMQRQIRNGAARPLRRAMRRIAPAAVVAALTTAIAFASLMVSSSDLIWQLGVAGSFSTILLTITVFAVMPLMFATLAMLSRPGHVPGSTRRGLPRWTRLGFLPRLAARYPSQVSIAALLVLALSIAGYARIEPSYSIYENIPKDDPALMALRRAEQTLAPVSAIQFLFPLEPAERFQAAHDALARVAAPDDVVSLASLTSGGIDADLAALAALPAEQQSALVSRDGKTGLLSVLVPYHGADQIRAYVNDLSLRIAGEKALRELSAPTGIITISSFISRDMLMQFTWCFIAAVLASGLVIGLWLRSVPLGLVALVPNVLPVAIVGATLALSGKGLQFTSGIALTIAFGLAIDDTVHVLNRLRLNGARGLSMSRAQIMASVRRVSPALVVTSVVLSAGISGTQFAQLASVVLFGQLSIAVYVLALLADLLVLPALLIWVARDEAGADAKVPA